MWFEHCQLEICYQKNERGQMNIEKKENAGKEEGPMSVTERDNGDLEN
jgi:hypothetical protein